MKRVFKRIARRLRDLELAWLCRSVVVKAGCEVDLSSGKYRDVLVERDGVLNITGPITCHRFENRGRVYEFEHPGLFRVNEMVWQEGSTFNCMKARRKT